MSEFLAVHRFANVLLCESLKTQQIKRGLNSTDLTSSWQLGYRNSDTKTAGLEVVSCHVAHKFLGKQLLRSLDHDKLLDGLIIVVELGPGLEGTLVTTPQALVGVSMLNNLLDV